MFDIAVQHLIVVTTVLENLVKVNVHSDLRHNMFIFSNHSLFLTSTKALLSPKLIPGSHHVCQQNVIETTIY